MSNTSDNAKRQGDGMENQEVPPQGNQVPCQVRNVPQVGNVTVE